MGARHKCCKYCVGDLRVRLSAWTLFLCGEERRMTPIRVHLADDHTMFREGLEYILSSRGDGDIEVVGRSSSGGEDAITLVEENKPDVVIAQIDVDLNTAKDILFRIRSASPHSRIVVLTMFDNLRYLERLGEEPVGALSERESEIVVLAARGLSNHQIATELNLSEATVKRHLANVYAKIGVGSRSEAVRTALKEQWIGLGDITPSDGLHSTDGSSAG